MDLDLDHYNYADLVTLFKLPMQFTEHQLKLARKIVVAVHPDKSGLDGSIFMFYHKAYLLLEMIYKCNVKHNADLNADHVPFHELMDDFTDESRRELANAFTKSDDFSTKFNTLFDSIYLRDQDGYEDWFRNDRGVVDYVEVKQHALTVTHVDAYNSVSKFSDLKDIHTTHTVIHADESCAASRPQTVEAMKAARTDIAPMSRERAAFLLQEQHAAEELEAHHRAHALATEAKAMENGQRGFWSKLMLLM